jgi:hypothetical protein
MFKTDVALSLLTVVNIFISYILKAHFSIVFPSVLISPKYSIPLRVSG